MDKQKMRHYVSQKMRESARLLQVFRTLTNEDASMQDLLTPSTYDHVIEAVRCIAGEDEEDEEEDKEVEDIKCPSIALKLGYNLQKLAGIKMTCSIKTDDANGEVEAKKFLKLMSADWADQVSSPALNALAKKKYSKVDAMPKSEDVKGSSLHFWMMESCR